MCLTIFIGIQMPNSWFSKYVLCECLDRPRAPKEVPFYFQEVRIGMLVVSIIFNLIRLIYEAIKSDISVILVAARLLFTIFQLADQWWFCKNWEAFFIQKKMRAYIWFRLFVTICMLSMLFCVQKTFPPYNNNNPERLELDSFQWASGLQTMMWYYWGKRWKFAWGDVNDDRRIRAVAGTMILSSLIYGFSDVYIQVGTSITSFHAAITAGATASIAFFLLGLGLLYLDVVTNRSMQACRRILDESIVASMAEASAALGDHSDRIHPPSLPSSVPPSRRHSKFMNNIRQSIESRRQSISMESQRQSMDSRIEQPDDAIRRSGNHADVEMVAEEKIIDEEEENGIIGGDRYIREYVDPTISFDDNLTTPFDITNDVLPHESDDIENASNSQNNGAIGVDRTRIKPNVIPPPSIPVNIRRVSLINHSSSGSNHDSRNDSNIQNSTISSNVSDAGADRVRVKPITTLTESTSSAIVSSGPPPLCDSTEHFMIDHVHVPLTRKNSLEANLVNYETAHLLSDKIMVVTVQVIIQSYSSLTWIQIAFI